MERSIKSAVPRPEMSKAEKACVCQGLSVRVRYEMCSQVDVYRCCEHKEVTIGDAGGFVGVLRSGGIRECKSIECKMADLRRS